MPKKLKTWNMTHTHTHGRTWNIARKTKKRGKIEMHNEVPVIWR